jgi:hypothetical protein
MATTVKLKRRDTGVLTSVSTKTFLDALSAGINKADDSINIGGVHYIASSLSTGDSGNATLVGGTIPVALASITANSVVILGRKAINGGGVGNLTYTLSPGVGFNINSTSGTDVSDVSWVVMEG